MLNHVNTVSTPKSHLDSVLLVLTGVQDSELVARLHLGVRLVGEVDTEVSRGLWSVSLRVELHLPVGVEVVVRTSDSKLAGPEELTVALRPLAEPLDGPSEGVLGVVADLGPGESDTAQSSTISRSYLHQDSLSMGGRMGDSSSSLLFILETY